MALKPIPWTKFAEHNFGSEPWSAFVLVCSEGNESPLPILGTYFKPPPPWTTDGNTMTSAYVAPAGQVKFLDRNEKYLGKVINERFIILQNLIGVVEHST